MEKMTEPKENRKRCREGPTDEHPTKMEYDRVAKKAKWESFVLFTVDPPPGVIEETEHHLVPACLISINQKLREIVDKLLKVDGTIDFTQEFPEKYDVMPEEKGYIQLLLLGFIPNIVDEDLLDKLEKLVSEHSENTAFDVPKERKPEGLITLCDPENPALLIEKARETYREKNGTPFLCLGHLHIILDC